MAKKGRRWKKKAAAMGTQKPKIRTPLAPPGAQMVTYPYQLKRVANVGTVNPVVARLQMQMFDLLDALGLAKASRDAIAEHTFVGSQWFVRAEQNKKEYARLARRFIAQAADGSGVVVNGSVLEVREPLNLGGYYQLFLIQITIGLRLFFKAAGMILIGKPTGWHELETTIEQGFAQGHPLRGHIDKHRPWSKTLYDDRGDVEHDPYMFTGFRVGTDAQGIHLLFRPVGADDRPLEDIMETYFQDGFVFAEELVAFAIQSKLPPGRQLEEIPEQQRTPAAPIRFRVR